MRVPLNGRGSTLIEVLIAVLVFMIGIEALLGVYTQSTTLGKRGQYAYTAYHLALNHVERLRGLNYVDLPSAAEIDTRLNGDGDPDPNGEYNRTTSVTSNYNGNAYLTSVTVSVNYFIRGTQSASPMRITTVIVNNA